MRIDPHRLLILRAVQRAGGVLPASRALYLTPSAVSQHLTRLEAETGLSLVDRTRRGGGRSLALTAAGRALAEQGERVAEVLAEAERAARIGEVLRELKLDIHKEKKVSSLSGGQRKRIALARTLILRPEIILYDEPTTGLDPITAREISGLIRQVQQKYQTAALIISHDMDSVRLTADRVALLADGRCYAQGTYAELAEHADPRVNDFFI